MVVTPAIANLIRENKTFRIDSSIQTGKKFGMQLLDEHLWNLYDEGKITLEEMLDKGRAPGALQEKGPGQDRRRQGQDEEEGRRSGQGTRRSRTDPQDVDDSERSIVARRAMPG